MLHLRDMTPIDKKEGTIPILACLKGAIYIPFQLLVLNELGDEPSKSRVPKAKTSRTSGVSHSKGKEPLYPPPLHLPVDPLAGLSNQSKINFLKALFSQVQSSKSNEGAFEADVVEASPRKRRPHSSIPKPPRKKAKAKPMEVLPELVILKVEGAQEARVIPFGPSIQEANPFEPQAGIGDNAEVP
ncbi:hypothetical protein F0562_017898 [Nyssa sinensis]|uniref:Uncharacterized protein n=1 Tax=Nyssa sinensis TaxID=561372 RepID=A0A5J4Z9V5_9ASTE|nr:hypothetical protein F0562_017898 [Nyssa sinensis]